MATTDSVTLDESTGHLTIESLTVEDDEIANFLGKYDSAERPEIVSEALTIGLRTMQLMDTSQDIEYIERRLGKLEEELSEEVEEFQSELDDLIGDDGDLQEALDDHIGENGELEERLEAAFSDEGPFVERLDEELGEDGDRIREALNIDDEESPTYRLEKRISAQIESLREKLVEEEMEEEYRSKTYFKGGDFEDSVEQILSEIVRQTPNNVEFTGDTEGEIGREVGDFVVTIADTDQNIVVETKTESYSTQEIKDEMEEALRNRDAAYGMFVTDTLENLPRTKTGWFHEFPEQNTVVVAMSEINEDELKPGYLRIAFNWARMRAVQAYAEVGEGFDPEKLQSEITEIEEDINRFKSIRGHCTEIEKSKQRIEDTLEEIERGIKNSLAEIEAELTKSAEA